MEEEQMATYTCSKCGMSVNISCAKCGKALVDDSLQKADGAKVQISKCPEGHGKVKSPMCCGSDMSCAV
jgi:DNA-directed RNA polymerase subunit RPC12/RpoP